MRVAGADRGSFTAVCIDILREIALESAEGLCTGGFRDGAIDVAGLETR